MISSLLRSTTTFWISALLIISSSTNSSSKINRYKPIFTRVSVQPTGFIVIISSLRQPSKVPESLFQKVCKRRWSNGIMSFFHTQVSLASKPPFANTSLLRDSLRWSSNKFKHASINNRSSYLNLSTGSFRLKPTSSNMNLGIL